MGNLVKKEKEKGKEKILEECPVCLEDKPLVSFTSNSICIHKLCRTCKGKIKKGDNPSCPICRYEKPQISFNAYVKKTGTRRRAPFL